MTDRSTSPTVAPPAPGPELPADDAALAAALADEAGKVLLELRARVDDGSA